MSEILVFKLRRKYSQFVFKYFEQLDRLFVLFKSQYSINS